MEWRLYRDGVGKWVKRGVGTAALVLAAGGTWVAATTWGEIHVVDAAPWPLGSTSTTTTTADTSSASGTMIVADCTVANDIASGNPNTDWATMVVDNRYGLREDYAPPDLVDASTAGFAEGDRIRRIMVDDLAALRQAAADNDTPIVLVSGYRSYERQANLFAEAVADQGAEEARLTTARPGHSEHQLGTTIDVLDTTSSQLEPAFADTPAGRWLARNAHRYGFVFSYPNVPVERSCYGFEPWHLRYVGRDVAQQIVDSGLTPREWMLTRADSGGSPPAEAPLPTPPPNPPPGAPGGAQEPVNTRASAE